MVDTLTKNFIPLHYTSIHLSTLHFLSFKLHPTTFHFGFTLFKFPTYPFHLTSLYRVTIKETDTFNVVSKRNY
jgi:hypothetical protein